MLDTKTLTVILVSTVSGAAIGFGLSYIFLYGQIHALQQDIAALGVTVRQISETAVNMTSTIRDVVETLSTGLTAVSEYAATRVNQLQAQLEALNSTITQIETRGWHDATSANAGPDLPTESQQQVSFATRGNKIQISWSMTGRSANATITIQIHQSDGTVHMVLATSGYHGTHVNELSITEPGDYYLRIYTYNVDRWSVTVRDYY